MYTPRTIRSYFEKRTFEKIKVPSNINPGMYIKKYPEGGWDLFVGSDALVYSGSYIRDFWVGALSTARARGAAPRTALILGQGAGSSFFAARHVFGDIALTGVDMDPAIIAIGSTLYSPDFARELRSGELAEPSQSIPKSFVSEAMQFLKTATERFDLIIVDLFVGENPAPIVGEKIFIQSVADHLTANGYAVINIFRHHEDIENAWNGGLDDCSMQRILNNNFLICRAR